MYLTRQADYAVRCVLYLSESPGRVASASDIARSTRVPKTFLAKILQRLVGAGIVKSTRGVNGGFQLAKEPEDINLLDTIVAIQGVTALNVCSIDKRMCSLSDTCSVHPIWVEIRKEVEKRLRDCSFAKLVDQG